MEELSLYKTVASQIYIPKTSDKSFRLISKNYRKTVGGAPEAPMRTSQLFEHQELI